MAAEEEDDPDDAEVKGTQCREQVNLGNLLPQAGESEDDRHEEEANWQR